MSKSSGLLIRGCRQLLTLRGPEGPRRGLSLLDLGIIPDGAVVIRHGVIQAVGSSRRILSLAIARDCHEIDAAGRVVMPGYVDLDVSLIQARPSARNLARLHRYYDAEQSAALQDVLHDGAAACIARSAQSLKLRIPTVAAGLLRHGTCTVQARAPYALPDAAALKVLRAQKDATGSLQTVPSLLLKMLPGEDPVAWATRVRGQLMPAARRRRLAAAVTLEFDAFALPALGAFEVLRAAHALGFPIHVRADPATRTSALPLAVEAHAASVAGFGFATPQQILALGASSTIAVFTPGLDFHLGMNRARPGRALMDAGAIPALASGYHPELSPGFNMQLHLLLACRLYRLAPEEAISAATINNAHALNLQSSVGSLETGKQADVLILNAADYREAGFYPGSNIVDKVIKRGILVYDSAHATDPH